MSDSRPLALSPRERTLLAVALHQRAEALDRLADSYANEAKTRSHYRKIAAECRALHTRIVGEG